MPLLHLQYNYLVSVMAIEDDHTDVYEEWEIALNNAKSQNACFDVQIDVEGFERRFNAFNQEFASNYESDDAGSYEACQEALANMREVIEELEQQM